jgi:hypothetical protein
MHSFKNISVVHNRGIPQKIPQDKDSKVEANTGSTHLLAHVIIGIQVLRSPPMS